MSGAKHEQALRRAVLQLSQHGDEDIGAVLARLSAPQRDKLRGLLAELGRTGNAVATPERDEDRQLSLEPNLQALLRRTPPPFAERFEAALVSAGQLHGTPSAGKPPRMTGKTMAVVAQAIADHARTSMPQPEGAQPPRTTLLSRWFGKRATR